MPAAGTIKFAWEASDGDCIAWPDTITLPERIHPNLVIGDENMSLFNLFRGHLLDHLFKANRRIRIASDSAERVPHVSPHQIGRRHAAPDFIVPANTGLCARMPLHRAAQVPVKGANIVTLDTEAHGVHDADQLFGIRVARAGRGPKGLHCFREPALFHKVAPFFNRSRSERRCQKHKSTKYLAHGLAFLFAGSALAELPAPLTVEDFLEFDPKQAALGHKLFYDPILSGNNNISCAHCHHPDLGTGDGLSLGIGEGGMGIGTKRTAGMGDARIRKRIPRNAPGLWNLGARDLHTMFHDGRLSISDRYENGFDSPAEEWLPTGFNSLLAAQAVFPLVAQFEMAGNPSENEVIGAVHDRIDAAWPILSKRVRITGYGAEFVEAFDHIDQAEDVNIVDIANALAAFMAVEWTSYDSPFDQYLRGHDTLSDAQKRGMDLFFGKAECSACHSGKLLSDQKFHALALPPFGPGRTRAFDPYARDVGRMGESDRIEDAYRFRTPMLRNVALTAPYGHNGAFATLEGIIRHHLDPAGSRAAWRTDDARLPEVPWLAATDFVILQDSREMARQGAKLDITPMVLSDAEVEDLVAFMHALTGISVEDPIFGVPEWFKP